jgi:uncharacterized membrane protein
MKKLLFLFLLLFLFSSCFAKSYFVENVDLEYIVNNDASIDVTEKITYSFNGSFSEADRYFNTKNNEIIEEIKVYDEKNGTLSLVPSKITYNPLKVTWNYQALNENKTFLIKYKLKNVIESYLDTFHFYFKIWPENFEERINNFNAKVVFPKPLAEGSKVWIYPKIDANYVLEGDLLLITGKNIPKRTFVETKVLFNKEILEDVFTIKFNEKGYDRLSKEAKEIGQASIIFIILPIIILLICSGLFFYFYKKYGVEDEYVKDFIYFREPPFEDKPYLVEYILTRKISDKSLIATLIDLVRRNHLTIENIKINMIFFEMDDFKLTWIKNDLDNLSSSEKELLSKLCGSIGVSITLQNFTNNMRHSQISLTQQWNNWTQKEIGLVKPIKTFLDFEIDTKLTKNDYFDFTGNDKFIKCLMGLLLIIGGLFLIALINEASILPIFIFFFFGIPLVFIIGIFQSIKNFKHLKNIQKIMMIGQVIFALLFFAIFAGVGFLFFISINIDFFNLNSTYIGLSLLIIIGFLIIDSIKFKTLAKLTPLGLDRSNKWQAFKKFIDDFSSFEDKETESVILWEKYLVYATVFGNSEKIINQLNKFNDIEKKSRVIQLSRNNNFSSFSRSVNSAFNTSRTSSSSGGSSSGGGGGRGGGGGGAR